jgi:hypothetical protein
MIRVFVKRPFGGELGGFLAETPHRGFRDRPIGSDVRRRDKYPVLAASQARPPVENFAGVGGEIVEDRRFLAV